MSRVVVCGGGNAAHVLACTLGDAHPRVHAIHILTLFADEAMRLNGAGGSISCIRDQGEVIVGRPALITNNAADAVSGSDVILLAVPAFAHETYLRAIAPFVSPGTIVGALPGEGGFDHCVRCVFGAELASQCVLFAMETLPWACRIKTYGRVVEILGTKKEVDVCVSPSSKSGEVMAKLQAFIGPLPHLRQTGSFLGITLSNINAVWHPTITYGQYRDWDCKTGFATAPLFYEGVDQFTADLLSTISNEILLVKEVLLKRYPGMDLGAVRHVREWMIRAYGDDIQDRSSLKAMINTNKGYRGLRHPMSYVADGPLMPDFTYRYISEDIPFGLLVTRGIAALADVPTPAMDRVIYWCQERSSKQHSFIFAIST